MASYANITVRVVDAERGVELTASEVDFKLTVSASATATTYTAISTPGTTAYNKANSSQELLIWGGQLLSSKYKLIARSLRLERPSGTVLIADQSIYDTSGQGFSNSTKYVGTKASPLVYVCTVYVTTAAKTQTMYFDARGGTLKDSEKTKTVTIGQAVGDLPTPTKSGATFKGWYYYWINYDSFKVTKDSTAFYYNTQIVFAYWSTDSTTSGTPLWPSNPGISIFITLDPNGGSVSPTVYEGQYTYGKYNLPTPTRSHATFLGWFYSRLDGVQFTSSTTVGPAPEKLYAHWKVETAYTVTLNANGGTTGTTSISCYDGDAFGTLPTPTRDRFSFLGWYTAASGGTQITSSTTFSKSTSPRTLYAHWDERYLDITFDPNGGTVETATKRVEIGSTFGTLPTPTREGVYKFLGWYTATSGGTQITESTVVSASSPTTLYAQWKGRTPTIVFDPAGGTVSPTSITKEYGEKFGTLPVPVRPNYNFAGWFTARYGGIQITADSEVIFLGTVYAHWLGVPVTITIDPNGGTVSATSVTRRIGEQYGWLADANKSGASFIGFANAETGELISVSDYVTTSSPKSLKCAWAETAGVTALLCICDVNAGDLYGISSSTYQLHVGDPLPEHYSARSGFKGFFTAPSGGTQVTGNIEENTPKILFARYEEGTLTIDLKGVGSGTTTPITRKPGDTYDLPTPECPYDYNPKLIKCVFRQWQLGSQAVASSDVVGHLYGARSVTIEAQWETIYQEDGDSYLSPTSTYDYQTPVSIKLVANGGTIVGGSSITGYKVGEKASTITINGLPGAYKLGYDFNGAGAAGWWTDPDFASGTAVDDTYDVVAAGGSAAYAKFTPCDIKITFYVTYGSEEYSVLTYYTIAFGSEYGTTKSGTKAWPTPSLVPEGYEFAGWFDSIDGETEITETDTFGVTSTDTLYAHYRAKTITVNFDPNGGSVTPTSKKVVCFSPFGTLPTPKKDRHTFSCWSLDPPQYTPTVVTSATLVPATYADTITIYAIWEEVKPVTVVFDPNGGSVDPDEKECYYGETYGDLPTPTKELNEFLGWFSEADGGELITASTPFSNTSPTILYAHWNQTHVIVFFDPNGGTVSPTKKTVSVGGEYGTLPTPEYDSHEFLGWFSALVGGDEIFAKTIFTLGVSPEILYAIWEYKPDDGGEDGPLAYSKNTEDLAFSRLDGSLIYKHRPL